MTRMSSSRMSIIAVVTLLIIMKAPAVYAQWVTNGDHIHNTNSGNVGIGTTSPTGKLHVAGSPVPALRLQNTAYLKSSNGVTGFVAFIDSAGSEYAWFGDGSAVQANMMTLYAGTTHGLSIYSGGINVMNIPPTGLIGIGTLTPTAKLDVVGHAKISGNLNVTGTVTGGNIAAHYQDIAEWVPTKASLTPGTVVVIDASAENHVRASSSPYDTAVAGVVSRQPGLILGVPAESDVMVATTGRVRVRADATRATISIGDILVSSDKPGTAMRSEPMLVNGRSFHQPGTIIGKALEALPEGEGEILVLLSMQ
jgi:hypothetical protein